MTEWDDLIEIHVIKYFYTLRLKNNREIILR